MSGLESDGDLARRIANAPLASRAAEAELCARFAPRIRLYGLRHLGDEERVRDLVQTVLVSVLEALRAGRLEAPDFLARFVLGVCRNSVFKVRTMGRRTEERERAEPPDLVLPPPELRVRPERLIACLHGLDSRASAVLRMSFMEERSTDEIGRLLETTPGNVRVLRHRALARLQSCLGVEVKS